MYVCMYECMHACMHVGMYVLAFNYRISLLKFTYIVTYSS